MSHYEDEGSDDDDGSNTLSDDGSDSSVSEGIVLIIYNIQNVYSFFPLGSDSEIDLDPIVENFDEDLNQMSDHESRSEAPRIIALVVAFLLKFQIFYKISDNAIITLLRFFKYLLLIIGRSFGIPALQQDMYVPQSMLGCRSLLGVAPKPFKEYTVCPKCHMLFDGEVSELLEGTGNNRRSGHCRHVQFPNHPQARFRDSCNTPLLNSVKRAGNRLDWKPRKVYCYYGIKSALSNLLERPEFLSLCNSWKDRQTDSAIMMDIIDGKVWHEEMQKLEISGSNTNVLGFLLNID